MRLGVFGGSFDPPHVGHLAVAQDAAEALALDLLLLVPARVSPFKIHDPGTPGEIRADMLERALAGHPRLRVWRGELERPAPSFTMDTLRALRTQYPEADLFLLMGEDQWGSFPNWREPEAILALAQVCVLDRDAPGDDAGPGSWPHQRVRTRRVDVSSTEIRARVAAGSSIRYLVPETVRDAITTNRLYGSPGPEQGAPVSPDS